MNQIEIMAPPRPDIMLPAELEQQPISAGPIVVTKSQIGLVAEWCAGYDGHTARAYQRSKPKFLDALSMQLMIIGVPSSTLAPSQAELRPAARRERPIQQRSSRL